MHPHCILRKPSPHAAHFISPTPKATLMNASDQTLQQIERALRKAASKFPVQAECYPLTDLHLQVKQESGELLVFDDDDNELTRCVVEAWIGNQSETFYDEVQPILIQVLRSRALSFSSTAYCRQSMPIWRRSSSGSGSRVSGVLTSMPAGSSAALQGSQPPCSKNSRQAAALPVSARGRNSASFAMLPQSTCSGEAERRRTVK